MLRDAAGALRELQHAAQAVQRGRALADVHQVPPAAAAEEALHLPVTNTRTRPWPRLVCPLARYGLRLREKRRGRKEAEEATFPQRRTRRRQGAPQPQQQEEKPKQKTRSRRTAAAGRADDGVGGAGHRRGRKEGWWEATPPSEAHAAYISLTAATGDAPRDVARKCPRE
ncbi:uncharacterized protein Tco025E_09785 [Trypanosoma conorhini]|uniref:Uncharacterized protein n=1 Tax=Trypanosoma conorhini TaxID=83891 RepID=A0A422MSL7_9TRYP|nr:uncharacterized protein Tco025E_09785 [Trypanosoma conorhini]RNE96212.1 hypothetical protein Tco025E_09785 [Trypanosoma conorhini]